MWSAVRQRRMAGDLYLPIQLYILRLVVSSVFIDFDWIVRIRALFFTSKHFVTHDPTGRHCFKPLTIGFF